MITKDEVKQITLHARIAFSDEELDAFAQKLNETIDMVSVIEEIDLTDVEPMFYPNTHYAAFRDPGFEMQTDRAELLANTTTSEAGYFKVPAVLKDGEA